MKSSSVLLLFGVFLSFESAAQSLSTELGDFGEAYQFSAKAAQFVVTNKTDRKLSISVTPQRDTDVVLNAPSMLKPHASAVVDVRIASRAEAGVRVHAFAVRDLEDPASVVYGQVRGFVESVLDDVQPVADFETVDDRLAERPSKVIRFESQDYPNLKIVRVLDVPDFVDVAVKEDQRSLKISIKRKVKNWGLKDGYVKVALNNPNQPQAWVDVRADIHGDVVPFTNPFGFGLARQGKKNEYLIQLDHRDGKTFALTNTHLEGFKGEVKEEPCVPQQAGCRLLKLIVDDEQQTGKLTGRILVDLPEQGHTLLIGLSGVLFKADAVITNLDKKSTDSSLDNARSENLAAAIKTATAETGSVIVMPVPPGEGPLLKWTVQNESQIYGYLVYRADSESGNGQRINDSIIRTLSTSDNVSVTYQWRDMTAKPGHTYWYDVETVNLRGEHGSLTGRLKKTF